MGKGKHRNGTIEIMRFIFCFIIILYHINNRLELPPYESMTFFFHGKIGVEFFFLVSGWLMAKSALKYEDKPILPSTKEFVSKKFFAILPYHLITYFVCTFSMLYKGRRNGIEFLFKRFCETLPNFFFLQKSGIVSEEIITPEWYIAAMLWMMLLIFPLILKYKGKFTKYACPIITILLIGYMIHDKNQLGGMGRFLFSKTISKAYVRAFAEMCGGVFCYEVSMYMKKLNFTKADRVAFTVIEAVCYILPIVYAASSWENDYESFAFYSLAIAVTITFSGISYTTKPLSGSVSDFLGRMSLPLYFAQSVPFTWYKYSKTVKALNQNQLIAFFILGTIVFAFILEFLSPYLYKLIDNKIKKLKKAK